MPETKIVDEVVNDRPFARGAQARAVQDESVSAKGGAAKVERSNVEDDTHSGARQGRALPESTEKLLQKLEAEEKSNARKPAPHEEGDADEDEPADDAGDADGEAGDDAGEDDSEPGEAGEGGEDAAGDEGEGDEEAAEDDADDPIAPLKEAHDRLEARNRELVSELETARKTPKSQRTERETALIEAEAAYYDAGSVPALRKFLSVIVGAAPDSKEVDAELSGLYTDLTARELGVTLDSNQQSLRDNARTRLLLARDKREKVEAEKKPVADNSADDVQYGEAAKFIDNILTHKGSNSETSIADEHPMLMTLARDFDGIAPGEVLARAIRHEIMTGTLDPKLSDAEMIKRVAPKIEKHYEAVAARIEAAKAKKTKKTDTATPSVKPKVAVEASNEQRRSTGARNITNATASRAPAKNPKVEKQKPNTKQTLSRKDFPSDAAWKDHLLNKHFRT